MTSAAVVTGAASGIGRALAAQLAVEGHKVYLADVAAMTNVVQETNGVPITANVARPEDMNALASTASDARLVCLNAGVTGASMGPPWEAPLEEWERVLRVNLLGVINGLRAFVPRLIATDEPAHVLITASLAGLVTFPSGGAYAATKHAVVTVAEQAAMALWDTAVGVTVLCPALVRSRMSETGADPADIAAIALQACRNGTFAVIGEEWKEAVIDRGIRLARGNQPLPPTPDAPE
jgi:NAD(P)-dependent dehydrogenase (short-subunit alcohol dehydrogenase family)